MLDKGEVREDVLNSVELAKPINFQSKYDVIVPTKQIAESTYFPSGTVLEFNVVIPNSNFTVLSNFELILPVRFEMKMEVDLIDLDGYLQIIFLDV